MGIEAAQKEIIGEFSVFQDKLAKYEHLISLGRSLAPLDDIYKTDEHAVSGCQSKVWITSRLVDGRVRFNADSDAMITKGMIALLLRVLDNRKPREIVDCDLYFIDAVGLSSSLSPARSNGLQAMVKKMLADAAALAS